MVGTLYRSRASSAASIRGAQMGDLLVFTGRRITSTRVVGSERIEAAVGGLKAPEQDPDPNREERAKPGESQPIRPGENDPGRPGEDPQSIPDAPVTTRAHPKPLAHPPRPEQAPEAQPPAERRVLNADEPTPESADNEI